MCDEAVVTDIRIRQLAIAQNRRTGIYDSKLFSRVMHPLMQVKIPLLASLFGLLLVSAIPSYAQTVS